MAIANVQSFLDVLQKHKISKSTQYRLLGFGGCPLYVEKEFNEPRNGGDGGIVYLKTGSIPERTVQAIEINYQGFKTRIPGQAEYASPLEFTFRMPEDYLWRNALEQWSFETYNELTGTGTNYPCQNSIFDVGIVSDTKGIVRMYRFFNVWPEKIGSVEYNVSDNPAEVSFNVSFSFSRWIPITVHDSGQLDHTVSNEIKQTYEKYRANIEANKSVCAI